MYTTLTGFYHLHQSPFYLTLTLNQRHLERLLAEYVDYYNNVRTHQALDGEASVKSTPPRETAVRDTVLSARPILGGLYHEYSKVA